MFRASKIRSREISLKNLVFKADSGANIHHSLALNSIFAKQLSFHKTPFRMFAVNPYSILANKANIKHFLQKHNINFLTFERQNKVDSTGSGEPILATEYIKNYFIKDDSNNKLIIFQLSNNSSITYDDISKYLELQFNSISEADEKAIEEVLGLKTEASEKINDLHLPLYSSVTVFKEKVLKPYLPHDSLIPYVSKPIYL